MIEKLKNTILKLHAIILVSGSKGVNMIDELQKVENEILEDEFAIFAGSCDYCNKLGYCTRDEDSSIPECDIQQCKHTQWLKIKEEFKD